MMNYKHIATRVKINPKKEEKRFYLEKVFESDNGHYRFEKIEDKYYTLEEAEEKAEGDWLWI